MRKEVGNPVSLLRAHRRKERSKEKRSPLLGETKKGRPEKRVGVSGILGRGEKREKKRRSLYAKKEGKKSASYVS